MVIIGGLIAVFAAGDPVRGDRPALGQRQARRRRLLHDRRRRTSPPTGYAITSDVDVHRGLISIIGKDGFSRVRIQRALEPRRPAVHRRRRSRTRSHDYLDNTAHTELTDFDLAPFRPQYRTIARRRAARRSGRAGDLDGVRHGQGDATLDWNVESGGWTLVLMNADGSRGVDATVDAGAQIPIIGQAAWIVTAAGLVILALRRPAARARAQASAAAVIA